MPTAAKLIAALALGLAAYGVAGVAEYRIALLRETGIDPLWVAFVAALVGWSHLGPRAYNGYVAVASGGIAAAFIAFALTVLAAAALHVAHALQYHAYKDVDAMLDGYISKTIEIALYISDGPVLAATIVGGALAGIFSAFAGRLWT